MVYLVLKPDSQHWELCTPHESENHVNVGCVLMWDIKEPVRTTSTLTMSTLSACVERSAWCKCSDKISTMTSSMWPQYTQTSWLTKPFRVLETTRPTTGVTWSGPAPVDVSVQVVLLQAHTTTSTWSLTWRGSTSVSQLTTMPSGWWSRYQDLLSERTKPPHSGLVRHVTNATQRHRMKVMINAVIIYKTSSCTAVCLWV